MSLPTTAGQVLSEEKLRAYVKCSEFYNFGGKVQYGFGTSVVKSTIESLIIKSLRFGIKEPYKDIQSALLDAIAELNQKENLLEPQINNYLNTCILWLKEFFELFPLTTYEPVLGRITPRISVEKTPIELDISGIFRSKNTQTIHAITFAPLASKHSILNDPCSILKIILLEPFVKKHIQTNRPQVILHTFGYGKNDNMLYYSLSSNEVTKRHRHMVKSIVKGINSGNHFPVLPCLFSCPYKKKCYPGEENV